MTQFPSPYVLRPISAADVDALHALSAGAGWPHRPDDWLFVIGLGSGHSVRDPSGRIAGCAMWWPSGATAGTVGMVIVSPALQGRGLGRRLMAQVIADAGERRLQLNATAAGLPLYEREGFTAIGAVHQHQGLALPPRGEVPALPAGEVRALRDADMQAVRAVDREATGRDRTALLDALAGCAAGSVHEVEGRIAGFAFTRAFGRGHVVGPLVARGDEAAIALFRPSLAAHEGSFLRADTPMGEGAFPRFVAGAGLAQVDIAVTMARGGPAPRTGPARLYCLASQALG